MMRVLAPAACLLALSIGGCATDRSASYPSLLPRAIETRSDAEPAAPPAPVAAADPALDARIAALLAELDASAAALKPVAARAERLAAAAHGAAAGSDAWIDAQAALAELDDYRAQASSTVGDLEQLAIARGADGLPDYPALGQANDRAEAALAAEADRIARLQAMLAAA